MSHGPLATVPLLSKEDTLGGGLWLGCHGDLLTAEEIAALFFCYFYSTYFQHFNWLRVSLIKIG